MKDNINQIIEDEKQKRYYNKFKKKFKSNWALLYDNEASFPSREAYFEINEMYQMFFTPGELRKMF